MQGSADKLPLDVDKVFAFPLIHRPMEGRLAGLQIDDSIIGIVHQMLVAADEVSAPFTHIAVYDCYASAEGMVAGIIGEVGRQRRIFDKRSCKVSGAQHNQVHHMIALKSYRLIIESLRFQGGSVRHKHFLGPHIVHSEGAEFKCLMPIVVIFAGIKQPESLLTLQQQMNDGTSCISLLHRFTMHLSFVDALHYGHRLGVTCRSFANARCGQHHNFIPCVAKCSR